jgi:dTDP-4-dehydrorhamnose reductase
MKIATTGPGGQLGRELVKQGAIPLRGRLMSEEMTASIEAIQPDAIINCAAMTDVDECERDPLMAAVTNMAGVEYLSRIFSGYLIQISTDYVFDGQSGPYGVRDAPNPINIYGWSKLGGELVTRRHLGPSLIIRTTVLFSATNNNFVAKIVKQLGRPESIDLYNSDIVGTPTYVPALAAEIMRMSNEKYTGIAHVAGSPAMTRLEFAMHTAETFGYNADWIQPAGDATIGARRPKKAGLICDHDGYLPANGHNWLDGLAELSKQKGIYNERPMERMETGRPSTD